MNQINPARAAHLKFFPATKPVNILAERRRLIAAAQKPKPEPVIHYPQNGHVIAWRAHLLQINSDRPSCRMTYMIREVAEKHGLTVDQIMSKRRLKHIVHARFEIMYCAATEYGLSATHIANRLGGLDHTTVINGIRRYPLIAGATSD